MGFFTGTKEKNYQQSNLTPQQRQTEKGLQRAAQGGGGAFQNVANYSNDLLSNDSETFRQFAAPEMRQFNEQIIPDLAEQFAGMGSGGLSSSGFQNAAVGAGTDLSERLGAIRANLKQQGAQNLFQLGQQAMQPTVQNVNRPATPGFFESVAPGVAEAAANYFLPGSGAIAKPIAQAAVGTRPNTANSIPKGSTSPYGNGQGASQGYGLPGRTF